MALHLPVLAVAAFSCPVLVVPANAGEQWNEAARKAAEQISRVANAEKDCNAIVVDVREPGAQVTMTTADGRRATRPVRSPEEVFPVIRALVVTVPSDTSNTSTQPPATAANPSTPAPPGNSAERTQEAVATASAAKLSPFAVVAGGGRLGFAGGLASPVAALSLGALLDRFEAGVTGTREFGYKSLSGPTSEGFALSAYSVDLFAGLRQRVADVALVAGIKGQTAIVVEQSTVHLDGVGQGNTTNYDGPATRRVTEQRVGAYLAAVYPLKFRLRLRSQLGFDIVAARFRDSTSPAATLPTLPSWGVALTLGVEGSVL